MFVVPVGGTLNIFCDNEAVVINASVTESTWTRNKNSINYHEVCDGVSAGILRVGK